METHKKTTVTQTINQQSKEMAPKLYAGIFVQLDKKLKPSKIQEKILILPTTNYWAGTE